MSTSVVIPSLGLTMEEGVIVEWLYQEGDQVQKDEPIVAIETDKAVMEVTAPASGLLGCITAKPGDSIPVGEQIAMIYSENDYAAVQDHASQSANAEASAVAAPILGMSEMQASAEAIHYAIADNQDEYQEEEGLIKASPAAKKLAREGGIDLSLVTGRGPGGRIIESDVLAYQTHMPKAASTDVQSPQFSEYTNQTGVTGMRGAIAKRMVASHLTTAPVTLFMEVRMDEAVRLRTQMNAGLNRNKAYTISYDAIFAKASAIALQDHRMLQAQWKDDRLFHPDGIHIGIAVALPDGLVVPVVRDADKRSLFSVAKEVRSLADTAKKEPLRPEATSGGTFTITNLGQYPVTGFTPVINHPEAAILGIGAIVQKPVIDQDKIVIAYMAELSLTFDHRIVDGAPAAAFLEQIKTLVEQPYQLFLEHE
ncbi:dihydrolipoamide acetyltransferase family protein [Paenibacillus spongiae]|uniref:Dihydrolipoamide acetyltransferase component of pyruvate dehydrogenase complex n=1 Tax=Paenibacillus spongiae TaxID=2909671 RepID=A0ABY5SH31_9BACL|nr:dihydrolipoamide acetyltransferase family protein [Paenibacillus spongiae]UVI32969.1 2-oxo acid dehydrogenase subunit E2 [Paenibacillus spongiae]